MRPTAVFSIVMDNKLYDTGEYSMCRVDTKDWSVRSAGCWFSFSFFIIRQIQNITRSMISIEAMKWKMWNKEKSWKAAFSKPFKNKQTKKTVASGLATVRGTTGGQVALEGNRYVTHTAAMNSSRLV